MRVTNQMMLRSTLRDLNGSLSRLQQSQTELSTGRLVRKPSDDPTKATQAMSLRTSTRVTDHRQRAAEDASGWLDTAGSTVMSGLDMMDRVKELTVQASNSGSASASSRAAISSELRSLRDELLAMANTRYIDRPIFNGTAAGQAYDPTTGAYLGNAAAVIREVAPDTTVQVNMSGEQVFGTQSAPGGDVFAVLDRLATAVAAGDTAAVAAEHANTDVARRRMTDAVGLLGARAARVEDIRSRNDLQKERLLQSLSEVEDADLAQSLISVKARENAYTAALQAASKVIPPSLVDYLR
jgi:flagellar hook-associated protein 3 FlgL